MQADGDARSENRRYPLVPETDVELAGMNVDHRITMRREPLGRDAARSHDARRTAVRSRFSPQATIAVAAKWESSASTCSSPEVSAERCSSRRRITNAPT